MNPDDIKEGDDVYFECHIQANPKPYKMAWFHNVSSISLGALQFRTIPLQMFYPGHGVYVNAAEKYLLGAN